MTAPANTPAPASTSEGIAAAIDAGISAVAGGASAPAPVVDDSKTGQEDTDNGNTSTDGAGDAGTDGGAPDGTPAGDGDGAGGDSAAGPDGGEPAGDGEDGEPDGEGDSAGNGTGDGKGAAPKAGSQDGKPGGKKERDIFNDPLPNALKPETKERIRELVKVGKESIARAEAAEAERNELMDAIIETKASPEQYAQTLDYLQWVNSGDRTKMMRAANFLISELSALSRIGGFRIPGITTYSGHKDLEEKVAAGQLTEELAEEIAATRAGQAHQGRVGAAQQRMAEARRLYKEADTKARSDMNMQEQEYLKSDPLYKAKRPMLVALFNRAISGDRANGVPPVHPSRWLAIYQDIYKNLPVAAAPAAPAAPGGVPKNTPLRAQQPAGGGAMTQEPKSMAEAIELGIKLGGG